MLRLHVYLQANHAQPVVTAVPAYATKALASSDTFKNVDTSSLKGQLLYAFNPEDEVGAAQV